MAESPGRRSHQGNFIPSKTVIRVTRPCQEPRNHLTICMDVFLKKALAKNPLDADI